MKLLKNDDYQCKNMTQDLQFLSNQNTPSLCPHNGTADKLRYQCIPREFFVSVREAPSQKDARNGNPYTFISSAPVALGLCRHRRARTHAHVHPTDQGRCCGTAIAHVNQASLPESTHWCSHLIYLYTSHRHQHRRAKRRLACGCVCFLCLIDNKRTSGSIPTRGFVFSQGELGLIA